MGRGIILLSGYQAGLQIYEYTPLQVKQAVVGYGRADKKQVMDMVRRILSLQAVPKPDDAADAVAIALCHARSATSLIHQPGEVWPMFYHINGVVTDIEPNLAVLECGGVGYALNVSLNTLASVKIGERAKLYIYECIREDAHDLYGFGSKSEKHCF